MIDIRHGDCRDMLAKMPDDSVHCVVTSPPYWGLRSYIADGSPLKQLEIGLEPTPEEYVANMVAVFREVRRVLRPDGVLFLNMGDCYATQTKGTGGLSAKQISNFGSRHNAARKINHGLKEKDLVGTPWRLAFALQSDGWYLRSDIIWHKPNPMPESVTDRPTKAHEYVFLLTKSAKYFWDQEAVKETATGRDPGNIAPHKHDDGSALTRAKAGLHAGKAATSRNVRSVWTIATRSFTGAHFATFPPELADRCIKAGTSEKGCCPACSKPWVRVVNVNYVNPGNRTTNGPRSIDNIDITAGFAVRLEKRTETTGWRPSCDCPPADPSPCIVLDPFSGAGTTAMVADRLGRNAIGIELNPEYIAMSQDRLAGDRGPLLDAMMESEAADALAQG